ncbi:MAG: hypothetical protein QM741_11030 [Rudaea sp.]|uniref:hypothetical protein n=1 Tax=Rudaea sp. TaxID=2136325 RepID=UPI0039E30BDE
MSDGFHDDHMYASSEPDPDARYHGPLRTHGTDDASVQVDWYRLADWLPRLGTVLWLYRAGEGDGVFPRARLLPCGVLLLDHPALAAFSGSVRVEAHSAVTAHGPREWLEFLDTQFACVARLYLLPDADYLAWDAMLNDCGIARAAAQAPTRWRAHAAFMRCALRRLRSSWQARAVRFPLLRLPCLHVLGLRAPLVLSELGGQLAAAIADDERAALQATHA